MELDSVADELYGLPPKRFTAVRDRRAREARDAGDRGLAEQIRRLRRPSSAAWAVNLLVREHREEARTLLRLGESLREAHRALDGERLRKLSAEQLRLISELARQAEDLAARAGQPIGPAARREVEQTLHAVPADPGAGQEWTRGRLTSSLPAPAGFPAVPGPAPASSSTPARPRDPGRRPAGRPAQAEREARRHAEEERAAARRAAEAAQDRLRESEERVTELARALEEARTDRRKAREAARSARERLRRAGRDG